MTSHVRPTPITDRLYDYALSVGLREPEVLRQLREETAKLRDGEWQTAPEQGPLLDLLIRITGAKQVLEVGTFTGYGTLWMALALPEDGRVVTLDIDPETAKIARKYWKQSQQLLKIGQLLGPAAESLDQFLASGMAGKFDLAYIDADKQNMDRYYEQCLELVRVGGLVILDNTLWDGKPADAAVTDAATVVIRNLNAKLYTDERIDLCFLPMADGMTICRKR